MLRRLKYLDHAIVSRGATDMFRPILLNGNGTIDVSLYAASDLLTVVKTVDGAGSGLDADLLDGFSSSAFARITEGTWTPALKFGGNSVGMTYTTQGGRYVRLGPLVWIEGRIILSAKGSSTGNATIEGLPFTASNTYIHPVSVLWLTLTSSMVYINGICNGAAIDLYGATAAAASLSALTHATFSNSSQMRFGGLYYTTAAFP